MKTWRTAYFTSDDAIRNEGPKVQNVSARYTKRARIIKVSARYAIQVIDTNVSIRYKEVEKSTRAYMNTKLYMIHRARKYSPKYL